MGGARGQPVDAVTIARRNGASLIIDGSYYRSGDSLLLTANLLDARGSVLRCVGPLATSVSNPAAGVEAMRARVMVSLASVFDPRLAVAWRAGRAPPEYEAYVPYMKGLDEFLSGQLAHAESLFALAASRDSGFDAAAIALATTAANSSECGIVDSLDQTMLARGRALGKVDYLTLRIAVARCHGHNDEMYRLNVQRARLVSATSPYQISDCQRRHVGQSSCGRGQFTRADRPDSRSRLDAGSQSRRLLGQPDQCVPHARPIWR